MGKVRGNRGGKDVVVRPSFVGDPAAIPPFNREPGTSLRKNKPSYKENYERRKSQ